METIQIKAERRTLGSKGALKQMRREGKVPAVLHDHGGDSLHLTLTGGDIKHAIGTAAGMNALLTLVYEDGGKQLAMIEQLERNPLKSAEYVHVNLTKISMEGTIEVKVPVVLLGQEKRAVSNGMLSLLMHELAVVTSPDAIPEHFALEVSQLEPGESIFVKDVPMPEGCTAAADPEELVVHIMPHKGGEAATDATETEAE